MPRAAMSRPSRPCRMRSTLAISVLLATLLCGRVTAAGAQASQTPAPGVAEAMAHIQRQDFKGAVAVLEKALAGDSTNARVWALLGYARRQSGDADGAVAAYEKALTLKPGTPAALYNGGLAQAQAGHLDKAYAWLLKAKATGSVDVTGVGMSPAAAALQEDPRYRELFPTPAEFTHPFVEPTRILREWDGEGTGDQFGWIARDIGDVDGDGIHDVVTSAPTHGEKQAGKVYVYSGGKGTLLWKVDGAPGEHLGEGLEAAGDVDGDGTPDVVAGAPGSEHAYIYSGKDGHVLFGLTRMQEEERFGHSVTDVGDVDGDGHADVMVGAPYNDTGGKDAGRAYVFSGRTGGVILTLTGQAAGDLFGSTLGGQTRNGHTTLVVGAPHAGSNHKGRVYVYDGLSGTPAFVVDGDAQDVRLGSMFVSTVGDVDGDGVPDVYSSDWNGNGKGGLAGAGRIYVNSGADGHLLYTLTGQAAGDGFGIGVADAGDLNGDGRADLVIGAWQFGGAAPSGGKVYVYSGKDGSLLRAITGKVMGETFGFDATGVGDVDGDGVPDLLLTSAWSAISGSHSGRMFIISGAIPKGG